MSGIRYQKFFKEEGSSQHEEEVHIERSDSHSSNTASPWRTKGANSCPRTPLLMESETEEEEEEVVVVMGEMKGDGLESKEVASETVEELIEKELEFPDEIWKAVGTGIFLGLGLVVTTMGLVLAHERMPLTPPLPDLILDNVKYVDWGLYASEYIMLLSILLAFMLILFHTHRFIIFRRVFFIMGLLYVYRAITFSVTVLPNSNTEYKCDQKYNGTLPFQEFVMRVVSVSTGGGLSINKKQVYCGDFIFSGHTMTLVTSYLVIREYSPQSWFLLHSSSFMLSLTGIVFLLIGRGHYTVDVVIAYMITTRLWFIYHTLANTSLHTTTRLQGNSLARLWWWRLFRYLEHRVPGPVPHRYSLPLPRFIRTYIQSRLRRGKEKDEGVDGV